ncbi:hypothetical protein [Schlesneria paludicola]|uniref:hypothetical protein n=1 Tax=Schlesneria paludicola TaxID=360056 RepID=UPI00029AA44A|nr:hypothetical protein [Schlesneria paludicola]
MRSAILVALIVGVGQPAFAQVVVQQPVVGQTAVSTSVSVPDRGSMVLGGTASGQMGRTQGGPLRSGASSGTAFQSSSMTTTVLIHDMRAMDEALLRSRSAVNDNSSRNAIVAEIQKSRGPQAIQTPAALQAEKAAKFEQLARNAEKAGKPGVAKVFWQSAAKCGSASAEKRLAELNLPVPLSPLTSSLGR